MQIWLLFTDRGMKADTKQTPLVLMNHEISRFPRHIQFDHGKNESIYWTICVTSPETAFPFGTMPSPFGSDACADIVAFVTLDYLQVSKKRSFHDKNVSR